MYLHHYHPSCLWSPTSIKSCNLHTITAFASFNSFLLSTIMYLCIGRSLATCFLHHTTKNKNIAQGEIMHLEHHHHLLFAFVLLVTQAYCTILSIIISSINCFLHQPLTSQLFVPVSQNKSAFILSTIIICSFYLFDK